MSALLVCNKGPSGQRFNVDVTIPARVAPNATYEVRIDSTTSGKISHFGLNYLHDVSVDYGLPPGAYVEGSAEFIRGTGTTNIHPGARLTQRGDTLTMTLPARIDEGTAYTAPSVTFKLRASSTPETSAVVVFKQLRLRANAIIVGDVDVSCDAAVKPSILGTTTVAANPQVSVR